MILQYSMFNDYKQKPGYSIVSNLYLFFSFSTFIDRLVQGRKVQTGYTALIEAPTHELLSQGLITSSETSCPIRQADTGLISTVKRQRS